MIDLEELKALNAVLGKNSYDDATFQKILPFVVAHRQTLSKLRALPLQETKGIGVMLAGARR